MESSLRELSSITDPHKVHRYIFIKFASKFRSRAKHLFSKSVEFCERGRGNASGFFLLPHF